MIFENDGSCKYSGYLNAKGQRQGVGFIASTALKYIGEWHND